VADKIDIRERQQDHSQLLRGLEASITVMSIQQSTTAADTQALVGSVRTTTAKMAREVSSSLGSIATDNLSIREATERIETAVQGLSHQVFEGQPLLLRVLGREMEHTITMAVRQELKGIRARSINSDACQSRDQTPVPDNDISGSGSGTSRQAHATLDLNQRKRNGSGLGGSSWVLNSSRRDRTVCNVVFGTLICRTCTVTYTWVQPDVEGEMAGGGRGQPAKKTESMTQLTFLPARWLSSRGAVLTYRSLMILASDYQPAPSWSLQSLNIVPGNSEIFDACTRCDIAAARRLFDQGRASPFDIDENGESLLNYLAKYNDARSSSEVSRICQFQALPH